MAHPQPCSRSRQVGVRPPSGKGGVGRVSLGDPMDIGPQHSTHAVPLRTARGFGRGSGSRTPATRRGLTVRSPGSNRPEVRGSNPRAAITSREKAGFERVRSVLAVSVLSPAAEIWRVHV